MVKNIVFNSFLLLHRTTSVKHIPIGKRRNVIHRWSSVPILSRLRQCDKCTILSNTCVNKCLTCDGETKTMNVTASSICKNCSSVNLTPVENPQHIHNTNSLFRSCNILSYDRSDKCSCEQPKTNYVSLSNIKSMSCSVAQKNTCDPTIEGGIPNNVRTTASGISYPSNQERSTTDLVWKVRNVPSTSWTCQSCTLLNNPQSLACEACESPYTSDFNSNVTPSVIIKVRCSTLVNLT